MRDTIEKFAKEELVERLEELEKIMKGILEQSKKQTDADNLQQIRGKLHKEIRPAKKK